MTRSTGQRRWHTKNILPKDPAAKRYGDWPMVNQNFYVQFRRWLRAGGYGDSAVNAYSVAARLALGLLDKPYWAIDPRADLERVCAHLATRPIMPITRRLYRDGLNKLAEYVCLRTRWPLPERTVNWDYYIGALPGWLAEQIRLYVRHCLRTRRPEDQHRATLEALGTLTALLRWMAAHVELKGLPELTPAPWFEFVEARLADGIQPVTINIALSRLQTFLTFCAEAGQPICQRMLRVEPLNEPQRLPKDVPAEHLRRLWQTIETATQAAHGTPRRLALMDRAWFLLMLHSGLRSGEVRRLTLLDLDWDNRRARIDQSKGLKDRFVYLSEATLGALKAYLAVRGPADALPPNVFIHKHQPLGRRYFGIRLKGYGKASGFCITAHQLRHSCATLLLNAGAPILTVQLLLGHRHIDTMLGYARLYDGTVAADYFGAMVQVERGLVLSEGAATPALSPAELLALVDALQREPLSEQQAQTARTLRGGILALGERGNGRMSQ